MKPHYHWIVVAYRKAEGRVLDGAVEVSILAKDEADAILKAKKLVERNHYAIRSVRECFVTEEEMISVQRRAVKALEKLNPKEPWEK